MKVSLKENALEINTEIKKADFDKKVSNMTVTNKDGVPTFVLRCGREGEISQLGLTCNSTIDKNLAVTIVLPPETKMEDIKVEYGKALVNAEKGLKVLAGRIEAYTKAIDAIFAE